MRSLYDKQVKRSMYTEVKIPKGKSKKKLRTLHIPAPAIKRIQDKFYAIHKDNMHAKIPEKHTDWPLYIQALRLGGSDKSLPIGHRPTKSVSSPSRRSYQIAGINPDLLKLINRNFDYLDALSSVHEGMLSSALVGGMIGRHISEICDMCYDAKSFFQTDLVDYFSSLKKPVIVASMIYAIKKVALRILAACLFEAKREDSGDNPIKTITPKKIVFVDNMEDAFEAASPILESVWRSVLQPQSAEDDSLEDKISQLKEKPGRGNLLLALFLKEMRNHLGAPFPDWVMEDSVHPLSRLTDVCTQAHRLTSYVRLLAKAHPEASAEAIYMAVLRLIHSGSRFGYISSQQILDACPLPNSLPENLYNTVKSLLDDLCFAINDLLLAMISSFMGASMCRNNLPEFGPGIKKAHQEEHTIGGRGLGRALEWVTIDPGPMFAFSQSSPTYPSAPTLILDLSLDSWQCPPVLCPLPKSRVLVTEERDTVEGKVFLYVSKAEDGPVITKENTLIENYERKIRSRRGGKVKIINKTCLAVPLRQCVVLEQAPYPIPYKQGAHRILSLAYPACQSKRRSSDSLFSEMVRYDAALIKLKNGEEQSSALFLDNRVIAAKELLDYLLTAEISDSDKDEVMSLRNSLNTEFSFHYLSDPITSIVTRHEGRLVRVPLTQREATVKRISLDELISDERVIDINSAEDRDVVQDLSKITAELMNCILDYVTLPNGSLPQGASTSPLLANYVLSEISDEIAEDVASLGGKMLVYMDDITIAFSDSVPDENAVKAVLQSALVPRGLSLNAEKTRLVSSLHKKSIFGVNLVPYPSSASEVKIRLSRHRHRDLRSKVHNLGKFLDVYISETSRTGRLVPDEDFIEKNYPKGYDKRSHLLIARKINSLRGHLAWAVSLSKPRYDKLLQYFEKNCYKRYVSELVPLVNSASLGLIDLSLMRSKEELDALSDIVNMSD